jgi:hypothetical protein
LPYGGLCYLLLLSLSMRVSHGFVFQLIIKGWPTKVASLES